MIELNLNLILTKYFAIQGHELTSVGLLIGLAATK